MKSFIVLFKQKWMIQLVGIVGLCLLIWFAGPIMSFADKSPFQPEFNRLLVILVLVVCFSLYNLIIQARASQKDINLMKGLAAPQAEKEQTETARAQKDEITAIQRKFDEALQLLRQQRSTKKHDKRYLYQLPWYIIIGAPGCGKTTLLINSGLKLPLLETLNEEDIPGVGGTRNCDWLFTDDAIFLDTAGRFVSQDSHQPVDAAGWQTVLKLIKKYRPRRPINGVLVTMSVSDLLRLNDQDRNRHSKVLRDRITELYSGLGSCFPIYMLFTKCDMISGFTDFFSDLDHEERKQVFGETFPGNASQQTSIHLERFEAAFDDLLRRLEHRKFKRIQEESDVQRRSLILDFPKQLTLIRPTVMEFLQSTFQTSGAQAPPLLRGVYFTSGTQEGMPIDRVLDILAATYGVNKLNILRQKGQGKSFFITRFLKKVLLTEADLAGTDPKIERRKRWLNWAAYACLLFLSIGLITIWWISYSQNKKVIERIAKQVSEYQKVTQNTDDWTAGMRALIERLDMLNKTSDTYQNRSLLMDFGLNQADKLQSGINQVHKKLLTNELLPRIKTKLELHLYDILYNKEKVDPKFLYDLLKVYLMFSIPEKMDPDLAKTWIGGYWEESFPREPQMWSKLRSHTDDLLRMSLEPVKLEDTLIAEARLKLNAEPLSAQIFAQLQSKAQQEITGDFRLQDALGPYCDEVFTGKDGRLIGNTMIPKLYTYDGFHSFFKNQGLAFITQALEDNWVLESHSAQEQKDLPRLYDDLQKIYFDEYKNEWESFLNNIQIKPVQGLSQTIKILDLLTVPDSPLKLLLETVEHNTSLTVNPEAKTKENNDTIAPLNKDLQAQSQTMWKSSVRYQLEKNLEQYFDKFNYLVRSTGESPPPFENTLARLNQVRDFLIRISMSAKSEEQSLMVASNRMKGGGEIDVIKKARLEFDRLPEPIKTWLLSLTSFGWQQTLAGAKLELNAIWKTDVLEFYKNGLKGRYPLVEESPYDTTMTDFVRFFGPNGIIEQFFQKNLKPFVDTSREKWQLVALDNNIMGLSSNALKQFQNAEKIRNNFFTTTGSTPSIQFELKPIYMDEKIASFRLNLEGQTISYGHGPSFPHNFQWPGPKTDVGVRMYVKTVDGKEYIEDEEGPWAWLKTLDKSIVEKTNLQDFFMVTFVVNDYRIRYELRANSINNPINLKDLRSFRCPETL
jgi:type VI secretion system protein ImpL